MRHLSSHRLSPFSHDSPTLTSLRGVRPLSATTATGDVNSENWPAASPFSSVSSSLSTSSAVSDNTCAPRTTPLGFASSPTALPMHPILFSRLSRRQMRQREQRWGALWRYQPDRYTLPHAPTTPLLPASSAADQHNQSSVDAANHQASFKVPSLSASAVPFGGPTLDRQEAADRSSSESPHISLESVRQQLSHKSPTPLLEKGAETTNSSPHTAAPEKSALHSPPEHDPLLAFLETHEDDAADLLAMWTALHRSCVYASALSESVVLQVRHVFHSLLHSRAIAAAVAFYYRLMGLGVQLQQSDLLLLLSSLPYEHATTTEAAQRRRAEESAALEKDRRVWARRREAYCKAAQETQEAARAAVKAASKETQERPKATRGGKERARIHSSAPINAEPETASAEGIRTVSSMVAEATEAQLPSAIAQRVAFQQQPEWIKRWILYEASMGTLDGLDTQEGVAHAPPVELRSAAPLNDQGKESELEWTRGAAVDAEEEQAAAAVQSQRASRLMELAAIVDHLRLLTLGAMQRDTATSGASLPPSQQAARRQSKLQSGSTRFCAFSRCRSARSSAERLYWRESLRVVRNAFAAPLWWTTPTSVEEPLILSSTIATTLQSMMRDAYSWEGAMAVLRLKASASSSNAAAVPSQGRPQRVCREVALEAKDFQRGAVLFAALAAASQPWKTQAAVEEWMHQRVLPRLAAPHVTREGGAAHTVTPHAAAVLAVHTLWLSHLCTVKAARPEHFITMAEEAAAYLPQPMNVVSDAQDDTQVEVATLLQSDLSVLIAEVQARAAAAVVALSREVHESMLSRRAAAALAKSIQSGAYRLDVDVDDDQLGTQQSKVDSEVTLSSTATNSALKMPTSTLHAGLSGSLFPSSSSSMLSDAQVDAFVLCCAAVKETVWLRFSTAALQDRASVTASVLQFLEETLYGSSGLHTLHNKLYGGPSANEHGNLSGLKGGGAFASAATSVAAPERACVSMVLATTLLELADLFCTAGRAQRRVGSEAAHRDALRLLVEIARHVVDFVQPSQLKVAPWRWTAEARVTELAAATARTLHAVVRELDVQPKNEKVMFAAMPPRDLQLLAELARLVIKTTDLAAATTTTNKRTNHTKSLALHQHQQQQQRHGSFFAEVVCCPVWRVLTSTASPHVLQSVQLCFRRSSPLGRRVRHHLTSREGERLDALLGTPRRARRSADGSQRRDSNSDAALVPRARVTDGDFTLALTVRAAVYGAIKRKPNAAGVGAALQELAEASSNWHVSLLLCQLATRDVALARGTCDMHFFTTVLTRMTSDLAERKAAAASAVAGQQQQHQGGGGYGGPHGHRPHRPSRGSAGRSVGSSGGLYGGRSSAGLPSIGPSSLWLSAIDVFWSAVDHTAGTPVAPSESLEEHKPPASTNEVVEGPATARPPPSSAAKQERAVLSHLLLPLIDFSRTINRVDLGRQWRRTWAAKYHASEKQQLSFQQQNILALSALGDASALERCVALHPRLGHDEELLCRVAAQHRSWQQALAALTLVYGSADEKGRGRALTPPYPLTVARTILGLLARSPTNLSNTAMRLETLQGTVWDAQCSALVVQLLLRSRRWSLALKHVETALSQQPSLHRLHARAVEANAAGGGGVSSSALQPLRLSPQEVLPYVRLLTLALQAAAIGGDSAVAPLYYDALKSVVKAVFPPGQAGHTSVATEEDGLGMNSTPSDTTSTATTTSSARNAAVAAADAKLDAVFAMTSGVVAVAPDAPCEVQSAEEKRCRAELRELLGRARLLFFRAMTKKMMSAKGMSDACYTEAGSDEETVQTQAAEEELDSAVSTDDYWRDSEADEDNTVHRF